MVQGGPGKSEGAREPTVELSGVDVMEATASLPADLRKPDEPGMVEEAPARSFASPQGRYEDVGEIGRGGMGRVNSVRDTRLLRAVAMKRHAKSKLGWAERLNHLRTLVALLQESERVRYRAGIDCVLTE